MMRSSQNKRCGNRGIGRFLVSGSTLVLGGALTVMLFLLLPVLQDVGKQKDKGDLALTRIDTVEPPPPPPEVQERKEEPPPPEEAAPPELTETAPPLDLSQLELALNPGMGDGGGGDFAVKLAVAGMDSKAGMQADEDIFSFAELDQAPRVVFQPTPQYPPELKKRKLQGTVYIVFIVDKEGRVREPRVQKTDHPGFDAPAMNAVKKWRFNPGKVGGQPVQFRMRVPMTFAL